MRDSSSTYSKDTSSVYSAVPPLPSGASQYGGSIHRGAGGSISSSNYGAPETPRAQAFSRLDIRDPHAPSHHMKSTRSRHEKDSDAGSVRSSKRAPSVASSRRAPSLASSHHAPSMAGSQYALQPYVASGIQPGQTAGQTPIPAPGSTYSFGGPPSVYQNQITQAQQTVHAANAQVQNATLAYSQAFGVQQMPSNGGPNNVYSIQTVRFSHSSRPWMCIDGHAERQRLRELC